MVMQRFRCCYPVSLTFTGLLGLFLDLPHLSEEERERQPMEEDGEHFRTGWKRLMASSSGLHSSDLG
jgi:hypothetical protein